MTGYINTALIHQKMINSMDDKSTRIHCDWVNHKTESEKHIMSLYLKAVGWINAFATKQAVEADKYKIGVIPYEVGDIFLCLCFLIFLFFKYKGHLGLQIYEKFLIIKYWRITWNI